MRIGVAFPNLGRLASPTLLDAVATEADDSGLADIWVGDHVAYPTTVAFPYSSYPGFSMPATDPILDPLTILPYLAARTHRVRLGVSVLIVPYRNPVLAARMLASLDVLSRGRVVCGVGAGWFAEEFEVLGADFAHRGRVTEEYLRLMRRLWTEESVTFDGSFYACRAVGLAPKPVQRPLPVWMGGSGGAVLARAARVADGWQPMTPGVEEYAAGIARLREALLAEGRADAPFTMSLRLVWGGRASAVSTGPAGLPTDPGALLEALDAYRHLGAEHALVTLRAESETHYRELLGTLLSDVVPAASRL